MTEVLFTNYEFMQTSRTSRGEWRRGRWCSGMAEGLLTQATMQGIGLAFLDMRLDIKGPTFAGDTIHVECEVIESRRRKSRPECGLVRTRNRVVKQDGTRRHGIHATAHASRAAAEAARVHPRAAMTKGSNWTSTERPARGRACD